MDLIEVKKLGLKWIDKILEKEITYTKAGSISYLLYGKKPSEQSINIKNWSFWRIYFKRINKIKFKFKIIKLWNTKIK